MTLSYLLLALAFNFFVGFAAFLLLVKMHAPADNAYHVVWGSAAFWLLLAGLACITTGWSSFFGGLAGGLLSFILTGPDMVLFTWGRAVISFANTNFIRRLVPVNVVLRFVGCRLQDGEFLFKKRPNARRG
jgi:hypothetical protein